MNTYDKTFIGFGYTTTTTAGDLVVVYSTGTRTGDIETYTIESPFHPEDMTA